MMIPGLWSNVDWDFYFSSCLQCTCVLNASSVLGISGLKERVSDGGLRALADAGCGLELTSLVLTGGQFFFCSTCVNCGTVGFMLPLCVYTFVRMYACVYVYVYDMMECMLLRDGMYVCVL